MQSLQELHIHLWTQDKRASRLALGLAQRIAVNAELVHDLLLYLRQGRIDERLPKRPTSDQWLAMYALNGKVFRQAVDQVPQILGTGKQVVMLLRLFRCLGRWARKHPRSLQFCIRCIGRCIPKRWLRAQVKQQPNYYVRHLRELRANMQGRSPLPSHDVGEFVQRSPALYFFFRVVVPCLFVHRQFPGALLERVEDGDVEAIEQLVRVDDLVIHHPNVECWASQQDGPVRMERQRMLRKWANEGLNHNQFSLKQVKFSMAGLIAAVVESVGMVADVRQKKLVPAVLTAAEIRDLFDAVAKDQAGRSLGVVDEDLEEMQIPSFARRISEHKRLWLQVLAGGQKFI